MQFGDFWFVLCYILMFSMFLGDSVQDSVNIYICIYIYIYEHVQNCVFVQSFSNIYFSNDGDTKPDFWDFLVAPTACRPISSCRASETHGN